MVPHFFASAAQLHSPLVAACDGSTGSVRGESESRAGGKERGLQEAPDDLLELAECSSLSSTLTTASTTAPPATAETTRVVDSGPQLPSAQAVQLHGDPRAWQGPHAPDYEWWDEEELDPHFFPCTPEAHASRVTPLTLRRTVAWQWWGTLSHSNSLNQTDTCGVLQMRRGMLDPILTSLLEI